MLKLPKWLRAALTVLGVGTAACMKVTTGTPQVVCGIVGGALAVLGVGSKTKEAPEVERLKQDKP